MRLDPPNRAPKVNGGYVMSDRWRHVSPGGNAVEQVFDAFTGGALGHKECVRDEDTGEYREVYVGPGQSVGEAIRNGQFAD